MGYSIVTRCIYTMYDDQIRVTSVYNSLNMNHVSVFVVDVVTQLCHRKQGFRRSGHRSSLAGNEGRPGNS